MPPVLSYYHIIPKFSIPILHFFTNFTILILKFFPKFTFLAFSFNLYRKKKTHRLISIRSESSLLFLLK